MNGSVNEPIIVIGAGRSGTNMLRDILTQIPGLGTWPCDEINYIWRHGNLRHPTDEFDRSFATEPVIRYIRNAFENIAYSQGAERIVEKTCANSLRVSFIDAILPNAKYIFVVRDGRDVVASALKRWSAPLDIPYILKKARYVPYDDLPYYALRYLGHRLHRLQNNEKRLGSWGPRFAGMEQLLVTCTLPEICAAQWQRCVERSEADFEAMSPDKIYRLQYEDFVQDPEEQLLSLATFLNIDSKFVDSSALTARVSGESVGKWQLDLTQETVELMLPLLEPSLKRYGYI